MASPTSSSTRIAAWLDAAATGDISALQRLLEGGLDINISNKLGWTALHMAARKGHLPLAQPWCACCAWLAGVCWALARRLLPVWLPGRCVGPVGACGGPLPGTTPGPALAGHAPGSRLGAPGALPPALLWASSLQVLWH
ncbi:hypothetical protein V8C86DRAFT_2784783 [Haematococcus lacustris]